MTLTAKSRSKPRLTICGIIVPPMAETSAIAEPDTPPKNSEDSTLTWPRPPRRCPTSDEAKAIRRSEMPPRIISSPAKMNSGIAISEAALAPAAVCCTTTIGGRPRYSTVASDSARPARSATGTPMQQQHGEHAEQDGDGHDSVSGAARRRGATTSRSSANSAISAPPTHIGSEHRCPAAAARRPSGRPSRRPAARRPTARASAPIAAITRRASDCSSARAARGRACSTSDEEAEVRVRAHAGGRAEHHRGAQQQQRHRLGPARANRSARSARTPASACTSAMPTQRDSRRRPMARRASAVAAPRSAVRRVVRHAILPASRHRAMQTRRKVAQSGSRR